MNELIRMLEARHKRQSQMLAQTEQELRQAREVSARQAEISLGVHDAALEKSRAASPPAAKR